MAPGIPADLLPHIFDPFVTTKTHGAGLGLALVAKIIGDHGGVIECEFAAAAHGVPRAAAGRGERGTKTTQRERIMPEGTILICDDDAAIRTVLNQALGRAGYDVRTTANAAGLWRWVAQGEGNLVITDVILPDENAFDLLPRIKRLRPELPVVVMSAQNNILTAITAAERGAYEYLPKPFDLKELTAIVQRALAAPKSKRAEPEPEPNEERLPLIGRSPAMQEIYRIIARLTQADLTVMISGESGTGKELVARALHDYGKRRNGSFVAVNMAAIPKELIESELFGHERGAFTGATGRGVGRFEQAEGGTLFLDEIGDMPLEAQTRLLRVLQQGEYTTVGGRRSDQDRCAHHRRHQPRSAPTDPAGPFPRGFVLSAERRADAPAALARAHRGHPRSGSPFPAQGGSRRPAAKAVAAGRDRSAEGAHLAGQCARAGKSDPAPRRPQSRRSYPRRRGSDRACATRTRHAGRGR